MIELSNIGISSRKTGSIIQVIEDGDLALDLEFFGHPR